MQKTSAAAPEYVHTRLAETEGAARSRLAWTAAIAACVTFIACYLRTFTFPHTPILLWGDQLLYATNGYRMVSGQMPYRDFFEFLPAGTDLAYALLFRCFGASLWIPNLAMDLLASISVLLITLAAGKVLRNASIALPAIFAVGLGLYGGLDATHHWFSTVFALAGMVTLLRGTATRHVAAAGVLSGLMASFTQSKGALVTLGFLVYVIWNSMQQNESVQVRWRKCLVFCGSTLTAFLLVNAYFMMQLGLAEWCRWVVVFPLRYYPTMPSQTFRAPIYDFQHHTGLLKWICVPFLYVGTPLIYAIFLWVMHRKHRKEPGQPWNHLLLIAITGIAMFLAVTPSLSIMRASAVSLPATILLAWLLERVTGSLKWLKLALATISLACALDLAISMQRMHWHSLDLPAGRAAILEQGKYDLYLWMKEHTRPGESYFGIAPLSFPLWLQCPAPIQAPGPWEYYRLEHIDRSIMAIEAKRIPFLVLRSYASFKNTPGYEEEHLRPLQDYVGSHYRRIRVFTTGDEIWQRIDVAPTAVSR
jgi:hypothetical protein